LHGPDGVVVGGIAQFLIRVVHVEFDAEMAH
jgi:hypothetical protein